MASGLSQYRFLQKATFAEQQGQADAARRERMEWCVEGYEHLKSEKDLPSDDFVGGRSRFEAATALPVKVICRRSYGRFNPAVESMAQEIERVVRKRQDNHKDAAFAAQMERIRER
ncbi:MAG: uncharacterized protein KVP18_000747 [Porospora cf. gigantea A]|uniref:uncharacterized protein n=1 Tax=Porospora cf. gigantea A TaxID=2853593 RepID=UPI0035596C57|nr:MAG: hypothetical protein KVP18_000747 [Porospora cf. gigantea A]